MTGLYLLQVGSAVSYLVAVAVPALDALIPVLPSETAVITLGVATAGSTDPRIGLLVALAAFGAFLGDNAAYLVGRRLGPAAERRLFAGERGTRRRAWAERSLHRFGMRIIIGCRFIPGGRTAVTLTCGLISYPRRRFATGTAVAGIIWACYAFFLGRLGGKVFEHQPWIGLLLALGVAVAVSVLIEVARRAWRWHAITRDRALRPGPVDLPAGSGDSPAADGLSLASDLIARGGTVDRARAMPRDAGLLPEPVDPTSR
jgi:membrane-associated protein